MTKGELLRLLEPLDDETEILVDLTQKSRSRGPLSQLRTRHTHHTTL